MVNSNFKWSWTRGLPTRITEHIRTYNNHAQNNAIVSHSYSKDHQINWNQSKIIFKNSDAHVRRLIEGAAMNLGNSFKGNKSFVNEDPYAKLCKTIIDDINIHDSTLLEFPPPR